MIFWVFYKNNVINIFGKFYNQEGVLILVDKNGVLFNPGSDRDINVFPIFEYPSELYPGKRRSS